MSTQDRSGDKLARGRDRLRRLAALPGRLRRRVDVRRGSITSASISSYGLVDYREMVEMLRAIEGRRTAVP